MNKTKIKNCSISSLMKMFKMCWKFFHTKSCYETTFVPLVKKSVSSSLSCCKDEKLCNQSWCGCGTTNQPTYYFNVYASFWIHVYTCYIIWWVGEISFHSYVDFCCTVPQLTCYIQPVTIWGTEDSASQLKVKDYSSALKGIG